MRTQESRRGHAGAETTATQHNQAQNLPEGAGAAHFEADAAAGAAPRSKEPN